MRIATLFAAAACSSLVPVAFAQEDATGSFIGVYSDFIWRGISLTDNEMGVQGGVHFRDKSGVYLGALLANVDAAVAPVPGDANARLDLYTGASGYTSMGLGLDAGVRLYQYDDTDLAFPELYLGFMLAEWGLKFSYDWDNDNLYSEINAAYDLGSQVTFDLHGGLWVGDTVDDYSDYAAGLSTESGGWRFGVRATATDIKPRNERTDTSGVVWIRRDFR